MGHRWKSLTTSVVREKDGTWSWRVIVTRDPQLRPAFGRDHNRWSGSRSTREEAMGAVAARLAVLAAEP